MSGVRLGLVVLVVLLGVLGFSAVFTVYQTEQALILRFGDPRRVITEPGLHFKLPLFVESVVKFDLRGESEWRPQHQLGGTGQFRKWSFCITWPVAVRIMQVAGH